MQNASAAAALLEYGARVNLTVGDSLTPLHEAVGAGSIDVAEMLVRAGANVSAFVFGLFWLRLCRTREIARYMDELKNQF